ncbi:hypothetical protein PT286_06565 [Neisseriaceae bacterium ESL0693]|nr:hypothetical protein [Neisseriaceae bacterium ESL0693]
MDISEKIILCEVAREAINGRFRAWLAVEDEAIATENLNREAFASAQRKKLFQLQNDLRVENVTQNQQIIAGQFEPQLPD